MDNQRPMRLFWSSRSPYVRKVMVVAHEVGLADQIHCERIRVPFDHVGSPLESALLTANPFAQIPTLVLANGEAFFDSLVICEYLDMMGKGTRMLPVLPQERLQTLHRHALGHGLADVAMKLIDARRRAPGSADVIRHERTLMRALDYLDQHMPTLKGSSPDVGHAAIAVTLSYLDFRLHDLAWRTQRRHLSACYESFAQRPSMMATEFFDELAGS